MKKTAKFLLVITVLTLIASIFSTTMISAADASTYANNLVTLYDFEGDATTALNDKSTVGETDDTLTIGNADNVAIANGAVTLTAGTENMGYLGAAAGEGTDLYSLQNKTVMVKLKTSAEREANKQALVIQKDQAAQFALQAPNATPANCMHARTFVSGSTKVANTATTVATHDDMLESYRWLVMSYSFDSTTLAYEENYYMSNTDNPSSASDFTKILTVSGTLTATDAATTYLTSASNFNIGKGAIAGGRLSLTIDEVRVYDVAIKINASEATTAATTTASTTTAASTTAASTTTASTTTAATTAAATTTAAETTAAEEGGCGSMIGAGSVALIASVAGASVIFKKKRK